MSTDQERDISAEVYSLAKQGGIALAEHIVKAREILLHGGEDPEANMHPVVRVRHALEALEGK